MFFQIILLEKIINETYKRKKEICEISGGLTFQTEKLNVKEVKNWLDSATYTPKGHIKIQQENEELHKWIQTLEEKYKNNSGNCMDIAQIKCMKCKRVQNIQDRRVQLIHAETCEASKQSLKMTGSRWVHKRNCK